MTYFGRYITVFRKSKKLSLKELADSLGVSQSQLSSMCSGQRKVTDDFIHLFVRTYPSESLTRIKALVMMSKSKVTADISKLSEFKKELVCRILTDDLNNEEIKFISLSVWEMYQEKLVDKYRKHLKESR